MAKNKNDGKEKTLDTLTISAENGEKKVSLKWITSKPMLIAMTVLILAMATIFFNRPLADTESTTPLAKQAVEAAGNKAQASSGGIAISTGSGSSVTVNTK